MSPTLSSLMVMFSYSAVWGQLAGFGIISEDRGRKGILFLSAGESIVAPRLSSCFRCAGLWQKRQIAPVCIRAASLTLVLIESSDRQVISDARRVAGESEDSSYIPSDPREFCNKIFHTCYMGTENSSPETRNRAKQLARTIGR